MAALGTGLLRGEDFLTTFAGGAAFRAFFAGTFIFFAMVQLLLSLSFGYGRLPSISVRSKVKYHNLSDPSIIIGPGPFFRATGCVYFVLVRGDRDSSLRVARGVELGSTRFGVTPLEILGANRRTTVASGIARNSPCSKQRPYPPWRGYSTLPTNDRTANCAIRCTRSALLTAE